MRTLAVAVLLVAVAYSSASVVAPAVAVSRGALEGALGGQWVPDVPVAHGHGIVAHSAPVVAAAPVVAHGYAGAVSARGAIEGALGGQWIPDVPVAHAAPVVAAHAAPVVAAHAASVVAAPVGYAGAVSARGAIEGALGGQWIPDVPVAHAAPVVAHAAPYVAHAAPVVAAHSAVVAAPGVWQGVDAKGALEGALGGQWIPDVHDH